MYLTLIYGCLARIRVIIITRRACDACITGRIIICCIGAIICRMCKPTGTNAGKKHENNQPPFQNAPQHTMTEIPALLLIFIRLKIHPFRANFTKYKKNINKRNTSFVKNII